MKRNMKEKCNILHVYLVKENHKHNNDDFDDFVPLLNSLKIFFIFLFFTLRFAYLFVGRSKKY